MGKEDKVTKMKIKNRTAAQRELLKRVMRELDKQMGFALDKGNCRATEAFAISYNLVEDRLNAILKGGRYASQH